MRYHKLKASDEPGVYIMESPKVTEADILTMANQLARQRLSKGRVLNNPSGDPSPSASDIQLTKVLKQALALIDVRVLDHIVVGTEGCASLAEKGLM